MTIHMALLEDRFCDPAGNLFLRAGGERISVPAEHAAEAAAIPPYGAVRYCRYGPHNVFQPAPVWDEQREVRPGRGCAAPDLSGHCAGDG